MHWIWYVFPQLRGPGWSPMAERYGINGLEETGEYMNDPVLARRLMRISNALLELDESDPYAIPGSIDVMKVKSCMTLFELVSDDPVFPAVLDKLYGGRRDDRTRQMLGLG